MLSFFNCFISELYFSNSLLVDENLQLLTSSKVYASVSLII